MLKPSFVLARDPALGALVLAVRGTHSLKDAFTSLTGASKPHHVADANGVTLGYAHLGMLASARWLRAEAEPALLAAAAERPGAPIWVVGHSLGGGIAALLVMMLRERPGPLAGARALAIACPAAMTLELAQSCAGYVTSVVNGADVVPTLSPASADALRAEVEASAWGEEFRRELRGTAVARALAAGAAAAAAAPAAAAGAAGAAAGAAGAVAGAAAGAAARAAAPLVRACYPSAGAGASGASASGAPPPPPAAAGALKRRNSDPDLAAAGAGGEWGAAAGKLARDAAAASAASARSLSARLGAAAARAARAAPAGGLLALPRRAWASASAAVYGGGGAAEPAEDGGAAAAPPRGPSVEEVALELEGSLEGDASTRRREVEAAVAAAEAAAGATGPAGAPAVLRPSAGGYGAHAAGAPRSPERRARELAWRRAFFPAGRIIHILPAHLLEGGEAAGGAAEGERWPADAAADAAAAEEDDGPAAASPPPAAAAAQAPASKMVFADPPPAAERMALVEGVPQAHYGRIRLSRGALSDHIIPRYLSALRSAMENR